MARKKKYTLDYYPHYAVQGDITTVIQELYGNDGYAVLHKNYEQFCLRDRQYIDLNSYSTLAVIAAYCKMSKERYLEIVGELVKLGAYDKEFWEKKKILISEKFIENTKDVYSRRKVIAPSINELKNKLLHKLIEKSISDNINENNPTDNRINDDINTQIKLNKIKLNKTKLNEINNNISLLSKKTKKEDPLTSKSTLFFISKFTKIFGKKPFLSFNDKVRLNELSAEYSDFTDIIPTALNRLKNIDFKDIDFKPSASWLLKGNNFERVMNGEFEKQEDIDAMMNEWVKKGDNK